jgi:lycopene cyclase domain-containing protein
MTKYTWYNLIFAAFTLPVSYWLAGPNNRRDRILVAARIGLLITVLLYPWDFFAIRLGAWTYPNFIGLRVYGVPLNDSLFIWLCSYLSCLVLIRVDRRNSNYYAYSERKRGSNENPDN